MATRTNGARTLRITAVAVLTAVASSILVVAANDDDLVYRTDPPRMLFLSAAEIPQAFPTPSQCVAAFRRACYTPQMMRKAYNIPPQWTGKGQTIVIVDAFGSPTVREDLETFSAIFGLPAPDLTVVNPVGSPTFRLKEGVTPGWQFETNLDVQWAHAIAPDAKLVLVVGAAPIGAVLANAQRYAVEHRLGDVMSLSFGADEAAINGYGRANNFQLAQTHKVYEDARDAGITVFAAAGDGGASDGFPVANALYPSSDPLVTAVGGTSLFLTDQGDYLGETVWNNRDPALCPFGCRSGRSGATGGAPSFTFAAPEFQLAVTGSSARVTSDVAYNANFYTAVLVYVGFFDDPVRNGLYFIGGTSAGAPQWAAIAADINEAKGRSLGYLNPALYAIGTDPAKYAQAFHDVTIGHNASFGPGFNAGAGYDLPTGLGSPNVAGLIDVLP